METGNKFEISVADKLSEVVERGGDLLQRTDIWELCKYKTLKYGLHPTPWTTTAHSHYWWNSLIVCLYSYFLLPIFQFTVFICKSCKTSSYFRNFEAKNWEKNMNKILKLCYCCPRGATSLPNYPWDVCLCLTSKLVNNSILQLSTETSTISPSSLLLHFLHQKTHNFIKWFKSDKNLLYPCIHLFH